ncbi:hypothetical protein H4S06_000925 [Coemansia sp. BCRC 34490]|nr:hypothetical protein H4S06_000925 [Coemansia sp. BCRC 34490]
MSIVLHCLAILNCQGTPVYMRTFDSTDRSAETAAKQQDQCVKYHYLAHTSCDVIEERLLQNKTSSDLYIGLLQTIGDVSVYGYVLNTGNRLILVTSVPAESSAVQTAEIKALFQQIHATYVSLICNPFYDMAADMVDRLGNINSPKFDSIVDELVNAYSS